MALQSTGCRIPALLAGPHCCAATTTDDGRRMSINVETIGGGLMVQHYVEDIGKKDHCRVLSTSDVLTPSGWTKIKVIWELSVKAIDKDSCELTNHVIGSSTPDFLHYLAKSGTPFESAKQSLNDYRAFTRPPAGATVCAD